MMARDYDAPHKRRASARTLGARPNVDIPVNEDESVEPDMGGISVSPDSPDNLPPYRRPPEFGGTGKDPIWELNTDDLPYELVYRPDSQAPDRHGFIEPAYRMTFEQYQEALSDTRSLWRLVG